MGDFFKNQIWWGKACDTHKRAFQDLKRTFMHVPGLPPPYFEKKILGIWWRKTWDMHKRMTTISSGIFFKTQLLSHVIFAYTVNTKGSAD